MIPRSFRVVFSIVVFGLAIAAAHPARANTPGSPLGVEFRDCLESIGVGLAPTDSVVALTPAEYIPVGLGTPVSPIVVRTADCAGIAVDGDKPKSGTIVQIGAVIVPPEPGVGDINNYTFWYYTTDARLAHRLQELGVAAQHVPTIRYDVGPEQTGIPTDLSVIVRKPGDPRFILEGNDCSVRNSDGFVRSALVAEDLCRPHKDGHPRACHCHKLGGPRSRDRCGQRIGHAHRQQHARLPDRSAVQHVFARPHARHRHAVTALAPKGVRQC